MWKLIFLVLLIGIAIHIFKRMANQSDPSRTHKNNDKAKPGNNQENTENMIQCASCAVHLPRSEAFLVNGHFYCCQAHIQSK